MAKLRKRRSVSRKRGEVTVKNLGKGDVNYEAKRRRY